MTDDEMGHMANDVIGLLMQMEAEAERRGDKWLSHWCYEARRYAALAGNYVEPKIEVNLGSYRMRKCGG